MRDSLGPSAGHEGSVETAVDCSGSGGHLEGFTARAEEHRDADVRLRGTGRRSLCRSSSLGSRSLTPVTWIRPSFQEAGLARQANTSDTQIALAPPPARND